MKRWPRDPDVNVSPRLRGWLPDPGTIPPALEAPTKDSNHITEAELLQGYGVAPTRLTSARLAVETVRARLAAATGPDDAARPDRLEEVTADDGAAAEAGER